VSENNPADSGADDVRVCAGCGAVASGDEGLTWVCSVEDGIRRYFCDTCSRTHLRAIEGRLDSSWW
jgi:hypothetical protein